MQRFRDVNFFRLAVLVGLSVITSLLFFLVDEKLSNSEVVLVLLQGSLAGFSFLQCPEAGTNTKTNERRESDEGQ